MAAAIDHPNGRNRIKENITQSKVRAMQTVKKGSTNWTSKLIWSEKGASNRESG